MAKFDDTPDYKRRRAWDGGNMSRAWSPAQKDLIRKLSMEVGAPWPMARPLSMKAASAEISALLSRKRKGIFGRAATARRR